MFRPKNLLPDPERFLKERFGFGVLAHRLVQRGQVIEADRRVGMFFTKNLLQDLERFLKERFGFGVLAHRLVQQGQVIQTLGRIGMFCAQELSAGSEGLPRRSASALAYSPIAWYSEARLLKLVAALGCSGPRTLCQIWSASRYSGSALASSPISWYRTARLLRVERGVGMF